LVESVVQNGLQNQNLGPENEHIFHQRVLDFCHCVRYNLHDLLRPLLVLAHSFVLDLVADHKNLASDHVENWAQGGFLSDVLILGHIVISMKFVDLGSGYEHHSTRVDWVDQDVAGWWVEAKLVWEVHDSSPLGLAELSNFDY
jgi:hypothetical protein